MGDVLTVSRFAALVLLLAGPLRAEDPVADYGNLLARSVKDDGVDYAELAEGRAALDAYVRWLGTADPGAGDADRTAFRINAHNALVLQEVLDTMPASVRDVTGFFDGRTWRVAGRETTIEGIEGEIKDPLVRFALYRAARGGPPLAPVLYRGADLPAALAQQARSFLADDDRNRFEYAHLAAELSMVFLWHRAEFEAGRKGDVPPLQLFLADCMPMERKDGAEIARSLRETAWRISYGTYDWSLDKAGREPRRIHPLWLVLYALAAAALLFLGFRAFRTLLRPPLPPGPLTPSPPGPEFA